MPQDIVDAAASGSLVLFAGAGVSTEGKRVYNESFYEKVAAELGLESSALSLSELMTRFSEGPNGRTKLLHAVKERFDYLKSFPEVYRAATRFHRSICSIPHLEEIFTTNWDDGFEREAGATPIVTSEDFVFWNLPGRKVFKLHGSINSYGSIVATKSDYDSAYARLNGGLIGAALKLSLATKTVLFVGYSGQDEDFQRLHQALRQEMGGGRLGTCGCTPPVRIRSTSRYATRRHRPPLCDHALFDVIGRQQQYWTHDNRSRAAGRPVRQK